MVKRMGMQKGKKAMMMMPTFVRGRANMNPVIPDEENRNPSLARLSQSRLGRVRSRDPSSHTATGKGNAARERLEVIKAPGPDMPYIPKSTRVHRGDSSTNSARKSDCKARVRFQKSESGQQ